VDVETSQRRQSARRPGLWVGRYRTGRLRRWTDCRVLDVSHGGAAIRVAAEAEVPSDRVVLELRTVGAALPPITVAATVRHARRLMDDEWHVGLEFTDLSPTDRTTLDRMIRVFAT